MCLDAFWIGLMSIWLIVNKGLQSLGKLLRRCWYHLAPQGSLLGPLLFLLFVNNLPDRCGSSNVICFADDTKIYKLIDSVDDSKALQCDLDSLMDWSTSTFLQFNQQKCKSQHITRKRNPIEQQYLMNGSVLDVTTAEKDLDVWISSNLTWTNQRLWDDWFHIFQATNCWREE